MEVAELTQFLRENLPATEFRPYAYLSKEADALTFYFADEPDYSKRLNNHVTLFLSIESDEIVGGRIKGVSGIVEDLANYIRVNHGEVELSIVFLSLRGGVGDEREREVLNRIARTAFEKQLRLEPA